MSDARHGCFCLLRHSLSLLLLATVTMLLGCGPVQAPVSDPEQATKLVAQVMGEWKLGKKWGETKQQTPPIYVTEDLWRNGLTLNDFSLIGNGELLGTSVRVQVNLKCTDKNGKVISRSVRYLVTTKPALTVMREEG